MVPRNQLLHCQWRILDFSLGSGGDAPTLLGKGKPRRGHVSAKMYVKPKELIPVEGGGTGANTLQLIMSL